MNLLAFDLATIPDADCGRRLYGLEGLEDADVVRVMYHRHRQRMGAEPPLPPHQRRLVGLTLVRRHGDSIDVQSLVAAQHQERTMLEAFFHQIERGLPVLVSWDAAASQLAVLHYRALVHGVSSARYWDWVEGEGRRQSHQVLAQEAPVYLAQVLGACADAAPAPLREVATLLGLPAPAATDLEQTWDLCRAGDFAAIARGCDLGALGTYLVYLRLELVRGRLSPEGHRDELRRLRERLISGGSEQLGALVGALV